MIVVIQSDDFDQSQGLIVVDPSQIQHVVGADGVRSTTVTTADGTTMILGSSSAGNEDDDEGKLKHRIGNSTVRGLNRARGVVLAKLAIATKFDGRM